MIKIKLHWQILISLVLAVLSYSLIGDKILFTIFFGDIFIKLLKMIIMPLILLSIISGVSSASDNNTLSRIGIKTFVYYLSTSLLAITIGLILTNILKPGIGVEILNSSSTPFDTSQLSKPGSLLDIIKRMIPSNPFHSLSNGEILPVIFFSIVFGLGIGQLSQNNKSLILPIINELFQIITKITSFIIKLSPIGVFGLIIKALSNTGIELFNAVGYYILTIFLGLSIHLFLILPSILFLVTKTNPFKHFKAMSKALTMAFSTSSSGATLPITMDCIKNKSGVSNNVSSFVLPLGSTVNMDGTALYECAGVLFIAQILGIPLDISQQLVIVLTAFLASVGAAGIPSAGLVMIFIVLDAVGLGNHPQVPIIVGTMLAIDRPLDMMRTMVNVFSDSVGTVLIAKSEGEKLNY